MDLRLDGRDDRGVDCRRLDWRLVRNLVVERRRLLRGRLVDRLRCFVVVGWRDELLVVGDFLGLDLGFGVGLWSGHGVQHLLVERRGWFALGLVVRCIVG